MAQSARDAVRTAFFNMKPKTAIIKVQTSEDESISIEMRQPKLGMLMDMTDDGAAAKDRFYGILIEHCYVPDTDERIFTKEDIPALKESPVGSWFSDVTRAFNDLTSMGSQDEAEGN